MAKILIVDDDSDMLDLVRRALAKDGHQIHTETDGQRLSPERCQQYDLILLDVMMPGEDGFSVCCRIRTEVDCPILFLTARTEDAALVQGFGLGADDYIKKTFQSCRTAGAGKCSYQAGKSPARSYSETGRCAL